MNGSGIVRDRGFHPGEITVAGTAVHVADVLRLLAAGGSFKQVTETFPELSVEDIREALRYAAGLMQVLDLQRDRALFTAVSMALAERDFDQQPPRPGQGRATPWEEIMGFFGLMKGK